MQDVQTLAYEQRPPNRDLRHIDGDEGWPFVGRTFEMLRDPHVLFGSYRERFGDVSRIDITGFKTALVQHPDHAEQVLQDRHDNFSSKMGWKSHMGDFFEGGLAMRDFGEHRIHRRIVTSSFSRTAMHEYADAIRPVAKDTVDRWGRAGEVIFYDEVKRLLIDIAFRVFCRLGPGDDVDRINKAFADMMEGSLGMIRLDLPGLTYRRGLDGRRYLKKFFLDRIASRRASGENDAFGRFCNATHEDGSYYADEDIADHMIFLMLAAHDTTTSAATMVGYYLANDAALQQKIAGEIAETPRPIGYDTVFQSMPTMAHSFDETLRLHPPVPIIFRRNVRACQIGGVEIPADTMVCVPTVSVQRHPDFWTRPNDFDPARYEEGRAEHKRHSFAWYPFGGGAHKCIGLHFARLLYTITFAELLERFELQYAKPNYFPAKLQHFPFTKPTDGLALKLVPRV